MRKAVIHALTVALAVSAFAPALRAAEEGGHAAKSEGEGEPKKGKPGTNVDMPYLMVPMTTMEGKLSAYAYLSTRLTASTEPNALAERDKLPFFRDFMVHDGNSTGITVPDDRAKA